MHDVLLGWTMEVSQKHNIVRVAFDTYRAFALTLLHSLWLFASHNALEKEGNSLVLTLDLPTLVRLHKHEIDENLFQNWAIERIGMVQTANQGWGMLINMFEQLEPVYL
ncbi:hypothetical protein SUGI_0073730 [Cryptomeria japonica]|nr:hypothetical protein SUGI_0073730 [Cryptomeria japonica]